MPTDKILSVILKSDSFFYVISDNKRKYLTSDDFSRFDINDINWRDNLADFNYNKIIVSILTDKFTLIPANSGISQLSESSINKLLNIPPVDRINNDLVYSQDVNLIYSYNSKMDCLVKLKEHSSDIRVQHYFTPILQDLSYNFRKDGLFAFIEKDEIGIVAIKNGSPVLVNYYRIHEIEEYLYYILLAFGQSGMSADSHTLYLAGQIIEESKLYRYIYKFVRNVSFLIYDDSPYKDSYRFYDMNCLMRYN